MKKSPFYASWNSRVLTRQLQCGLTGVDVEHATGGSKILDASLYLVITTIGGAVPLVDLDNTRLQVSLQLHWRLSSCAAHASTSSRQRIVDDSPEILNSFSVFRVWELNIDCTIESLKAVDKALISQAAAALHRGVG